VVDTMEKLFKFTLLQRGRTNYLTNRYSERNERARKAINRQIKNCRTAYQVTLGQFRYRPAAVGSLS
jgi:hypothetical protein